jgi:hypothetical protein
MKTEIQTFDQMMAYLRRQNRKASLLMGNGFSMAFDKGIFSYNALFDFVISKKDALINKLFATIKTKNFGECLL